MQNSFISSILLDLVTLMKTNKNFFDLEKTKRQNILNTLKFPKHLEHYFKTVQKEILLEDLEEITKNQLKSIYRQNRIAGARFAEFLSTYFNLKIDYDFNEINGSNEGNHFILIQSPTKLEVELEEKIRETLLKKFPRSAPIFSINKKIGGGLRIFIDGVIQDYSWASKINNLNKKQQI